GRSRVWPAPFSLSCLEPNYTPSLAPWIGIRITERSTLHRDCTVDEAEPHPGNRGLFEPTGDGGWYRSRSAREKSGSRRACFLGRKEGPGEAPPWHEAHASASRPAASVFT